MVDANLKMKVRAMTIDEKEAEIVKKALGIKECAHKIWFEHKIG